MASAKLGPVQIRLTMLDAEGLSSRVNTESIQNKLMTRILSSVKMEVDKNPNT